MSPSAAGASAGVVSLQTISYLWLEIASTKVLMWMANPTGMHDFQPHVHLYLADRYGRLAAAHRHRWRFINADRLAAKAEEHFYLGGGDDPPPAAAVAVGRPRRRAPLDNVESADPTRNEGRVLPFVPKKPSGVSQLYR